MTFINTLDHQADQLYTDTFWQDIYFGAEFTFLGSSDPTLVQYPANGGVAWYFTSGDEVAFGCEIPHWWKVGTDGKLHVHWTPHSRGTTENGNTVNWRIDLSIADEDSTFPAVTTYTLTATCPNQNDGHLIQAATADIDLSSMTGVSAWISGRVYRLAGDSWAGVAANSPYLLQAGMHLEKDRPGSRQEYIK